MNEHSSLYRQVNGSPSGRFSMNRLTAGGLCWIALLAFAVVATPLHVRVVFAQEVTEITVAAAELGEPPAPQPRPASEIASGVVVEASDAAAQVTSEVTSEVASNAEVGELPSSDESQTQTGAEAAAQTQPSAVEDSVRTLSVEPGVKPILPDDRPAWVGASPDYSSTQHYLYVGSLPTSEESDADEALDAPLLAAVRNYIDQEVVNEHGAAFQMPVDAKFIRKNLIDDSNGYVCELSTSQGPMYQKWVTVRVTPEQRELFQRWQVEAAQRKRLAPLGVGLLSVLALVSASHLVLRRRHRPAPLPAANPAQVLPPVAVKRSFAKTLFKTAIFIGFLMLPLVLLLSALVPTQVKVHRSAPQHMQFEGELQMGRESAIEVNLPNLHKEIRIDKLEGGRSIIIEHKSGR